MQILETLIRSLLDFPSSQSKSQFLEVMRLSNKFSLVFAMTLSDSLKREFFSMKTKTQLTYQDSKYLSEIANLISKICINSAETTEEHIATLVFPYL
jgi:hypothetical protein